jgi:hypothetical protein
MSKLEDVIEGSRHKLLNLGGESWHLYGILLITRGFVHWVWRIFSIIILLLFVLAFIDLLARPARPDLILIIAGLTFCGGLLISWRWELLGGIISCLAIGTMESVEYFQGKPVLDTDLVGYLVCVVGMLPLLSWTLSTVTKPKVRFFTRISSFIILPLIVVAIGFCIYKMKGARFNP